MSAQEGGRARSKKAPSPEGNHDGIQGGTEGGHLPGSNGLMFRQPFYVSPHAVKRFKERVADLSTRTVRAIIQAALQGSQQIVVVQRFNRQECPVFKARYRDVEYLIPVLRDQFKIKDAWPVVPTILLPGMETNTIYERRGWHWDS